MLLGTNGENLEIVVPHGVVLSLDNGAAIGKSFMFDGNNTCSLFV